MSALTAGGERPGDAFGLGPVLAAVPAAPFPSGDRVAALVDHCLVHASLLGHVRHRLLPPLPLGVGSGLGSSRGWLLANGCCDQGRTPTVGEDRDGVPPTQTPTPLPSGSAMRIQLVSSATGGLPRPRSASLRLRCRWRRGRGACAPDGLGFGDLLDQKLGARAIALEEHDVGVRVADVDRRLRTMERRSLPENASRVCNDVSTDLNERPSRRARSAWLDGLFRAVCRLSPAYSLGLWVEQRRSSR